MKLVSVLKSQPFEGDPKMMNRQSIPVQADRDARRTVIPTPKSNGMFPGWGVKF